MKRIMAATPVFLFLVWAVMATLVQAQEHGNQAQQNNLPQQGGDFGPLKVHPLPDALHGDAAAAAQLAPRRHRYAREWG